MNKLIAVKLRATLYLIPVAVTCFGIGFVFGENMGPQIKSCSIIIHTGMENYGKPLPRF
jgi:uncharacterized membrane protein YdjX (TVP38/TMEM64 family)